MNKFNSLYVISFAGLGIILLGLFLGFRTSNASDANSESNPFKLERNQATATFAGGCFWCMEPPFEKLRGVQAVISGYTGGHKKDPTYKEVSRGVTGHVEAIQVHYIPTEITYEDLLKVFWRNVDPTDKRGQFVDRGQQYTTAIFYHDDEQKNAAQKSKQELAASGRFDRSIVTPIIKATEFYPAEGYHQDFYKKSSMRYKSYRSHSGRDQFLDKAWGLDRYYVPEPLSMKPEEGKVVKVAMKQEGKYPKPSKDELKKTLTPLQYKVTQKNGTEPPFQNTYHNNKKAGIYVDIVSGEPLFSSKDKYDSRTGWPSFTRPLEPENIVTLEDNSLFMTRVEVRSKHADSHLGHVFDDGPMPTRKRFCINSASLRFIPASKLVEEGYGQYAGLFGM